MTTKVNGTSGRYWLTHVETDLTVPTGTSHLSGHWRNWSGSEHHTFKRKRDATAFMVAVDASGKLPNCDPTQHELIALREWLAEQL